MVCCIFTSISRLAVVAVVGLWATAAIATPVYPNRIFVDLALDYLPDCTLCHQTVVGGTGTATKRFAQNLQDRGLVGGANEPSLSAALVALEDDAVDSDRDGTADIDELRIGSDPNGPGSLTGPQPEFGCFGSIVPDSSRHASGLGLLLAAAGLVAWRRRH